MHHNHHTVSYDLGQDGQDNEVDGAEDDEGGVEDGVEGVNQSVEVCRMEDHCDVVEVWSTDQHHSHDLLAHHEVVYLNVELEVDCGMGGNYLREYPHMDDDQDDNCYWSHWYSFHLNDLDHYHVAYY